MNRKIKNIISYSLAFLIPCIFFLMILFFKEVLTGKTILILSDLEYQYYPLLIQLKRIFLGTQSATYSFFIGLGSSMIGTISYYLSSFFNLIVLFFDLKNIHIATMIIIVLKFSFCGLTMFTFLKYHFKNKKNFYLLLFSSAYALSLFNVANYFQIIWFDAILLAPLLLLGIDKIVDKNKPLLYGIVLFLIILTNYYMGYICCVFSLIYFIYKMILSEEKFKKKKIISFSIVSLLSGLMTMFLSLPTLLGIMEIERNVNNFSLFNTDIIGILSKGFIGSHNSSFILNRTHPFLYCGIFILPLLFFYFFNKNFKRKEKIATGSILIILVISILFNPLNNAWHAFSYPVGFNYRYIFLFVIFILYICCKSFFQLSAINKKTYFIAGVWMPILGLLVYFRSLVPLSLIYVTVALYFIYLLIYYYLDKHKDFKVILIVLVLAELYFNMHIIFLNLELNYTKSLLGRYNEKTSAVESIKEYDDSPFYRIEFEHRSGSNDSVFQGYNGASAWFSSVDCRKSLFQRIGYVSSNNVSEYLSYYPLDSIFGIKYLQSTNLHDEYKEIDRQSISFYDGLLFNMLTTEAVTYENPYALSLGYIVKENGYLDCSIAYECQNLWMKLMTNNDLDIYEKRELSDYKLIIDNDLDFYFYADYTSTEILTLGYEIYINEQLYKVIDDVLDEPILIKNDYEIGEELNFSIRPLDSNLIINGINIYYFHLDNFIEQYNILKENQLNIEQFDNDYLKGNIELEEDGSLFLSIPYEKGFTITVNGESQDYYKMYDHFIGIDLKEGFNEIEISYHVPGISTGIIISLVSTVLFGCYIYINKKTIID